MEVAKGKEWAEGLDQRSFEVEFVKRHPKSDVIPRVEKWVSTPYTKHSVEKYIPVDKQPKIKPPEQPDKDVVFCPGCKKEFKGKPRYAHLTNHKKRCADFMNMRSN